MKRYISLILLVLIVIFGQLFTTFSIQAEEYKLRGVIDIRATVNDTITSFRDGGYGKFDLNNNENLSLAQAGGEFIIDWDSGISAHIIANTYLQNGDGNAGITEGYLKYFSVPNEYGYRWQTKLGIFYPEISLENNAIAWASKNTLNSSTLNTWIGEEIRVLGNEYTLTRLGKYHQNSYDVAFTLGGFVNNDPSGALLAWHGWTLGNRQTLWTEKVTLPPLLALEEGKPLSGKQSKQSDPFYQVGDKIGWHSNLNIKWHKQGKFSLGYYDNNADPYEISEGQYAWRTRFYI